MTPLQRQILDVLADTDCAMPPNRIGEGCRARGWNPPRRHTHNAKMLGLGSMLRSPIASLLRQGLIQNDWRPDGLTGTAYSITAAGRAALAAEDRP